MVASSSVDGGTFGVAERDQTYFFWIQTLLPAQFFSIPMLLPGTVGGKIFPTHSADLNILG